VEYRLLGKLEVLRDGFRVDLGAFRQRALFALLLTSPNTFFSTDQIIDGLWGTATVPVPNL
jgi:DNA-binding SARP family transcriptional activator